MLTLRLCRPLRRTILLQGPIRLNSSRSYSSADTPLTENPVPANTPNPPHHVSPVSKTNQTPSTSAGAHGRPLQESIEKGEELRILQSPDRQSPNRKGVWSPSQMPRAHAMVGPRFEQMIMIDQPRPYSAIELIHKQPVRWVNKRVVSCDGGGGPLGHPRIFINVDKPQICACTYCGLPFAHEHHRAHLESLPETSYPLGPTGDKFEVLDEQLAQK